MKIKMVKYLLILPLFLALLYLFYENNFVVFEPTMLKGDEFKVIQVGSEFYPNLKKVLDYDGESDRINNQGKVMVKRNTIENMDLLISFTHKALDAAWLNYIDTHRR